MIEITRNDFSVDEVLTRMKQRETGAIVTFIGIVRGENKGQNIDRLEIQAYREMALSQLEMIKTEAEKKYSVNQISIVHRIGVLHVSDNIVLIAVGASHREEAFKACRFILEELKKRAPLWKKEFTSKGSYWIQGENND